ncbi:hypothetical protein LTR85_011339 [Meristemomyces frigidus]|nr:hypothetical protein LTR85_011339 [Meristemomyces frigidus]
MGPAKAADDQQSIQAADIIGPSIGGPSAVSRAERDRGKTGQLAALVRPSDIYATGICETIEVVRDADFAASTGTAIPLAHCLGIPLRLSCMANITTSVNVPNYNKNYFTTILGVVVDPDDRKFGKYMGKDFAKTTKGSVLLSRSDGKDFGQQQAEVLFAYCGKKLGMLYDGIPKMWAAGVNAKAAARSVAEKLLTPEAYAVFWEKYRVEKVKVDKDWEGLECPVVSRSEQVGPGESSVEGCGACGAEEGEGGRPLLQCARCGLYAGLEGLVLAPRPRMSSKDVVLLSSFARFFDKFCAERAKVYDFWKQVPNPVDSTSICGICGAKEGKDSTALLQCGKCKKQKYCSKECQKKDWKGHKRVCKAA